MCSFFYYVYNIFARWMLKAYTDVTYLQHVSYYSLWCTCIYMTTVLCKCHYSLITQSQMSNSQHLLWVRWRFTSHNGVTVTHLLWVIWCFTSHNGVTVTHLLCVRWLRTRSPVVKADISDSSAAMTVAQTTLASVWAFTPGFSRLEPFTPNI